MPLRTRIDETGIGAMPVSYTHLALSIRLRGTGSMNAGNEPLYVIDGIPVVSGDVAVSGVSGDTKSFNIMSSLNPSDIENITILKDAAAASLYGSRAANGEMCIRDRYNSSFRI